MKKLIIAGLIVTAGACWGQVAQKHTVTVRHLDSAEENLIYEHKRTIGLRKYEIERQLKSIRDQRAALTAQNQAKADYYSKKSQMANTYKPPTSPSRSTTYRWQPPKPDWKNIENPEVLVKGAARIGDEQVALVTGGKIIYSNDVFSTTYQGEERIWRCTDVSGFGASFERLNPDGTPWPPPEPEIPWWKRLFTR